MVIYNLSSWNLSAIAPKDIEKSFKEIERKTVSLEKKRKILTKSISSKTLISLIKEFEQLRILASRLGAYAQLKFSEDSSNQQSVAQMSKIENFLTKINNRLLFFNLWFKSLPEKKAQQLIKESGKYNYYFNRLRKTKPYTLKENEEKIISLKDLSGASALNNIYNILTSQFKYDFAGKKVSQEELINFVRNHSPKKREQAYQALLSPYIEKKDLIGEIYKSIINDWREENVCLRGYKSPLSVRDIGNDIPDRAVEALLKTCEKNQHLFHKFFEIKRKKLGLKKLRRFDIYAPTKTKEVKINYNKAVKLVIDTFENFSPRFRDEALRIINDRHVHSKPQKNKQTGAYCYSVNSKRSPYVLLSYTGTLRDVSTLAHELGHGVHHNLAKDHTEFTFHSSLPLAETASIFSEMLLSEKLMKDNPKLAKGMIFTKLDDLYASIIRQAGFVNFEIKAHQMMNEGKTIDEISKVYIRDLKKQLGPRVDVDKIFAYEWCYIPHIFHTPFYCYAYAFGNLLTLALYEMYKERGSAFTPKIINMLSKGGSESPLEITKAIGVDICSEKFWQKGFKVIERMVEEIE